MIDSWVQLRTRLEDGGLIPTGAIAGGIGLIISFAGRGIIPGRVLGDPLPLALEGDRFAFAIDLVYGPGGTAWTRHASASGVRSIEGLSMLVHQALLSLERWYGPLADPAGTARAMWSAVAPGLARPESER